MTLPQVFEHIWLDRHKLDPHAINQELIKSYTDQDWCELIQVFLRGIESDHTVPGDVVYALTNMAHLISQDIELTWRQQVFVINRILDHWDQISCDHRASLNL
jgi:hypothetical protein